MHQKKNKKVFIYIFFFLFLGTINNHTIFDSNLFKIKKFNVLGLDNNFKNEIESKLYALKQLNIFYIDKNFLNLVLNSNSLIENYYIFKIYPSTLNIKIKKTNFLAKLNIDGDIFLIGSNGKLTKDFTSSNSEKLPFIFGNPNVDDFLKTYSIINTSGFKYESIKNLYFYKSGRIDVKLNNDIIIKLPIDNFQYILKKISQLLSDTQFNKRIIDARVPNQLILYD